MGSDLIFIPPLIACHNYNLGLKKGFGINWINLAAISCACMLIHSAPPLEKNLIKYTNNTFKPDRNASWEKKRSLELVWNQNSVIPREKISTHTWWQQGWKVAGHRLIHSPHLISLGLHVSSSSLHICLFFFFTLSLDCSHTNTHVQACWSRPPLRSSNMQLGSRMIKAVAGGLHFETINRPPRAESNSKPSISVSASSRWHRGRGHAEGERADSASVSSSYTVARCWKTRRAVMEEFLTLWCDFKQALWIHSDDPAAFDLWRLRGSEGSHLLQHFLFLLHWSSLQTLKFNELWSNSCCSTVYGIKIRKAKTHVECF